MILKLNILKKNRLIDVLRRKIASPSGTAPPSSEIFDRKAKRIQRNYTASLDDFDVYQYLKNEVAYRVADRIYDIKKYFHTAADLGCGAGFIAPHVFKENVGMLMQVDMSDKMLRRAKTSDEVPTCSIIADEELQLFRSKSLDLIVSSMSMHWINDLPGFFSRCFDALRPDGVLIGALLGGETLYELRCSLQLAEMERRGGLAPHISPFTEASDIASLLHRAGFELLTIDADEIEVSYPSVFHLLSDLQDMAESSAAFRRPNHIYKDVLHAASAIYKEKVVRQTNY